MTNTAENMRGVTNGRSAPQQSTETRPSIRTSEFIVFVVTSLLMIIVAYTAKLSTSNTG